MNTRKLVSWAAGILVIVLIAWVFRPENFLGTLLSFDRGALAGWLALTLVARLLLAGTTVLPLRALGFELSVAAAFWIGWIRTFSNLLLPLSGIAAYAKLIRSRVGISWPELAALVAPQFVLAVAALGLVGLVATAVNVGQLDAPVIVIAVFYLAVTIAAVAVTSSAGWLLQLLPASVSRRLAETSAALRRLSATRGLIGAVVLIHVLAIVLRGARLWFVFGVLGVTLDWRELLLMIAIAESTMLVNLTPGGLGIREGLVLGAAALVDISAPVAASAALIDRVFTYLVAAVLSVPAFLLLGRKR